MLAALIFETFDAGDKKSEETDCFLGDLGGPKAGKKGRQSQPKVG